MEPKIRLPHHNFTEAVRHPEPASNLERYVEQRRLRPPSQKQNKCRILSVCMYVCVCVTYGLQVIVFKHEVQPNL